MNTPVEEGHDRPSATAARRSRRRPASRCEPAGAGAGAGRAATGPPLGSPLTDTSAAPWTPADSRALRSVAAQFWVNGAVFASYLPRLPEIRASIGVDLAGLGLLLTLGVTGGLVSSAVCGRILERTGPRIMTTGGLGMAGALAVVGLSTNRWMFLAALMTLAFFDVLTDVSMNLAASRLSARREVPVINRLHGLWSVGTLIGGMAATAAAASTVSLRTHLLIVSVILVATVVYVRTGLPSDSATTEPGETTDGTTTGGEEAGRRRRSLPLAAVLFCLMGLAAIVIENAPSEWASLRMADDLGAGPLLAGAGYVAVTSGMVLGRFGGDHATAVIGARRLTRLSILVSAGGSAVATLTPSPVVSLAGFFVAGVGAAVIFPRLYDEAATAPGRTGSLLGPMAAGIRLGALATPALIGALASTDAVTVGGSVAIATAGGAVLALTVREQASAALVRRSPPVAGPEPLG